MRLLTSTDSSHAQPFQNKAKLGMAWCIGYCVEALVSNSKHKLVQYSRMYIFVILQESQNSKEVICGTYNFSGESGQSMYTNEFCFL